MNTTLARFVLSLLVAGLSFQAAAGVLPWAGQGEVPTPSPLVERVCGESIRYRPHSLSCSTRHWIFPVPERGSASMNSINRGTL